MAGLQSEFQASKYKLEELIQVNQNNYQGAKELLSFMYKTENLPNESDFSKLLSETFSYSINFSPNNSTLEEMINSGSLKDIENSELRIQLTSWIATLESIARQEQELGGQKEAVLNLLRNDSLSLRTLFEYSNTNKELRLPAQASYKSNLKLLQSTTFENNVLLFYLTSYATDQAHYLPLLEDLNTILLAIEAQIKS